MKELILTDRQKQYLNALRPVNDPSFPTEGFYFIRGIREREDNEGNIYPYASVNWRRSEDDEWEHGIEGNSFWLRLDHLFTNYSLHPDVSYENLRHQVIHIKSVKVEYLHLSHTSVRRVYTDWDITGFKDAILDALPYYSLFDNIVSEYEFDTEQVNSLAIEVNEEIDELSEDDVDEGLFDDELDEHVED